MAHVVELPEWAIERGRVLNDVTAFTPARTAFVAIDMQNVFLDPAEVFGNANARDIVPAVNRLAAAFRSAGAHIVWTRQTIGREKPLAMPEWQYDLSDPTVRRAVDAMTPGARGHAIYSAMAVAPADVTIDKYRYGAFSCPAGGLAKTLAATEIDTIVIAGTSTNCCCDSTAREANMRGYRVLVVSDATATSTNAEHNAAILTLRLNFADVRTTEETLTILDGKSSPRSPT